MEIKKGELGDLHTLIYQMEMKAPPLLGCCEH